MKSNPQTRPLKLITKIYQKQSQFLSPNNANRQQAYDTVKSYITYEFDVLIDNNHLTKSSMRPNNRFKLPNPRVHHS